MYICVHIHIFIHTHIYVYNVQYECMRYSFFFFFTEFLPFAKIIVGAGQAVSIKVLSQGIQWRSAGKGEPKRTDKLSMLLPLDFVTVLLSYGMMMPPSQNHPRR